MQLRKKYALMLKNVNDDYRLLHLAHSETTLDPKVHSKHLQRSRNFYDPKASNHKNSANLSILFEYSNHLNHTQQTSKTCWQTFLVAPRPIKSHREVLQNWARALFVSRGYTGYEGMFILAGSLEVHRLSPNVWYQTWRRLIEADAPSWFLSLCRTPWTKVALDLTSTATTMPTSSTLRMLVSIYGHPMFIEWNQTFLYDSMASISYESLGASRATKRGD